MHRTEGANNVDNLYVDGPPGTTVEQDSLNAIQEEIANVIEEAGIALQTAATDTRDQLWAALGVARAKQYATARYTQLTAQSFSVNVFGDISYNRGPHYGSTSTSLPVWDIPGSYRVTSNPWKFTADRAMKVRVTPHLCIATNMTWSTSTTASIPYAEMQIVVTRTGNNWTVPLDRLSFGVVPSAGRITYLTLDSSTIIRLEQGDFFRTQFRYLFFDVPTVTSQEDSANTYRTYIDIEEI